MPRTFDDGYDLDSGPQFAVPRMMSVTRALLWINGILGAVFFVAMLWASSASVAGPVFRVLSLAPAMWRENSPWVPVWQLASYSFLHSTSDLSHVLFNMLALYFFGGELEGIVGSRRFFSLYMTSVVLGAVVQLIVALAIGEYIPVVGASGGVLFAIVAIATLRPHARVIFILFPISMRTLALILVGYDVVRLLLASSGHGGDVAFLVHLTGAAFGFVAVKAGWIWFDPLSAWQKRRADKVVEDAEQDEQRLDRLLQQIHDRGIGSLSGREREFLKRMSSRK
jgi:membrane associated rhomboid family serine protease